jgi:hypothetical protein
MRIIQKTKYANEVTVALKMEMARVNTISTKGK